jgi:hypothetical protein
MNETEMAARKRAAAARSRLLRIARERAEELRALVPLCEPAIPADKQWIVVLAAFCRANMPEQPNANDVGQALAAVSVALHAALQDG